MDLKDYQYVKDKKKSSYLKKNQSTFFLKYIVLGASEQDRHDGGTSKQGTNIGQMTQTVNNYYFTDN